MLNQSYFAQRKFHHPSIFLALMLVISGCSGPDATSDTLGELQPIWLLDANRDTQSVQISGRVFFDEFNSPVSNEYDLFTFLEEGIFASNQSFLNPNTDNNAPTIRASGLNIRLVSGDLLQASNSSNTEQLFRREEQFVYRTILPFNEIDPFFELQLRYDNARFPTNTTTARIFDTDNLSSDLGDSPLADPEALNVSWNIGDVSVPEGHQFFQNLTITLSGCDTANVNGTTQTIELDSEQRSIALSFINFIRPTTVDGITVPFSLTPSACTYSLQVNAIILPIEQDENISAQENAEPPPFDITPVVVLINRTNRISVRVANGPEMNQ